MDYLSEIAAALEAGRTKQIRLLIPAALEAGLEPLTILNEGLLHGMARVGAKFRRDEVFVPEVLIAAHAIKIGLAFLGPSLKLEKSEVKGTVVLGTVQGDLHDIGKNMVRMLMECRGLRVIDLGVDVPAEQFVATAIAEKADIIACSALLTTTMEAMRAVIRKTQEAHIRHKVKIMIGGAPVSQAFCNSIGADAYTPDAVSAADKALALILNKA